MAAGPNQPSLPSSCEPRRIAASMAHPFGLGLGVFLVQPGRDACRFLGIGKRFRRDALGQPQLFGRLGSASPSTATTASAIARGIMTRISISSISQRSMKQ